MLSIGDKAPAFTLQDDTGSEVKLSDFQGKQLVIFFYPKADTPGCTTQACGFRDNYPTLETNNAEVIGVSPDTPEALAKWKKKMGFQYPLLADVDHEMSEAYGVWGTKKMFGNEYKGIIRSHVVIDGDGNIADLQIKVSPKQSVQRALKFIEG